MKVKKIAGLALVLIGMIGAANGEAQTDAQLAADGWRPIPRSWAHDYTVLCKRGKDIVYGVYDHGPGNTSDWGVARHIYTKTAPDGRITAISLVRGFTHADISDSYFPTSDVSCDITEQ
ncbi:hypothetical protein [Dyella caseinilytica]|uniref:Uncharacterized protein n=1 Tax=Dyella caseinilytica TaxID=1849581 RepID=A0ABX7GRS2_9GAMM|nr:hypothetical protein [Dyella caseinilytica]QRN52979.1 hypothetical protein ISN74_16265 [Dyella caseinilytica]GGA10449.1 hypothetical protein GCM10011408_34740 [Dyella caseinilytica]